MAITNKLITFNKLTSFETQLAQGNILETSIVFIKDAKKIWTKGTYFDCSGGGSNDEIGYTTDFSVADIEAVYGRGITKPVNVQGLMSAIEANKLIIIPTNITDASQVGGNAVTMAKMDNDGFIYLNVIVPYLDGVHKEYFIQIKITTAQLIKSGSNGSITLKELVAKTDLKTINGESILGSGNFDLATTEQLRAKQDTLVSGTSIKTINSTSLLGSGNIAIKDTKNLTYILNNSTSGTVTLQPNACIYMPNPLTGKLAINACATISSNNADLIESRICFRMPASGTIQTVQFNGVAIRWAGGNAPTFEADFTYEVSLFYPSNANSVGPMGVCVGFK